MKSRWAINILVPDILACMPGIVFGGVKTDSLLLHRVFNYAKNNTMQVTDTVRNIYLKYYVDVQRRNASLMLVPHYTTSRVESESSWGNVTAPYASPT